MTPKVSTRRAEDATGAYVIANAAESLGCTVISIVYGPRLAFDDEGKPISTPKRFLRLFFSPKRDQYFCYHVFYRNNGVENDLVEAEVEQQAADMRTALERERAKKGLN